MRVRQLFLDADGVLADMELGAQEVLGLTCKEYRAQHSEEKFWATLHAHPEFYETLPLMPDARVLYEAVAHLNPIILTGCPMGGWAQAQKLAWRNKHFPGVPMITTLSKDKRNEAKPGDVLIDDYLKYRHLWEEMGGIFIHHKSAQQSLAELSQYIDWEAGK